MQRPLEDGVVNYKKLVEETLEQCVLADKVGFDYLWFVEHHFLDTFSGSSSPEVIMSALSRMTKNVRLGFGVMILPHGHPIRFAEKAAMLDHLSDGRVDVGTGRSAPYEQTGFGVDPRDSREMWEEALQMLPEMWTREEFSHEGKFWKVPERNVLPKPLQKPHPPIRIGATSEDTFELVGRMGYPIFINPSRVTTLLDLKPLVAEFHQAREKAGHTGQVDVGLRVPVYVAETKEKAYSEPKERTMFQMQRLSNVITQSIGAAGISAGDDRAAQAKRLKAMTYEDVLANTVVYGTPESVVERLQQLREELGLTQVIYEVNFGCNVPLEHQIKAVQLINEQVAPNLKS